MIDAVAKILSNNILLNVSQNTAARVSIETGMKAVGRPGFILIDKDLDPKAKKYAATKEFLYQLICLGVYLLVIPPIFKKGAFAFAKKAYKDKGFFDCFKNSKEFLDFHKKANINRAERIDALQKGVFKKYEDNPKLIELLKSTQNMKEALSLEKGVIETSSFIGSILGLAILAPEVSHKTIHPIMRALGLEKQETAEKTLNKQA